MPESPTSPPTSTPLLGLSDPERWVDEHGDYLFKYALSRLRDPLKAEDAVQETFLAALKGGKSFQGRSAEKSWLVGILKNKICDHYRKAGRETAFTDLEFYSDEECDRFVPDVMFKDGWIHELGPQEWDSPGASRDSEGVCQASRDCSNKLPTNIAPATHLRDVDGLASMFIGYARLEQRWVPYAYLYPFGEALAGILMTAHALNWLSVPVALLIGGIGAISVFYAVYVQKRELKCACVGGNSNVPLGFVSLTENLMMVAMGVWMIVA